jgi:DNA-binding transcriptional MocR family regulator
MSIRFGDDLMQGGFTGLPNRILEHYAELGIEPIEMMFIIQVWQFWWGVHDPYPSMATIAKRMGVSRRQVQRYVGSLRLKGFLEVNERYLDGRGQATSEYDFEPLLKAVREHLRREGVLSTPGPQKAPPGHARPPGR